MELVQDELVFAVAGACVWVVPLALVLGIPLGWLTPVGRGPFTEFASAWLQPEVPFPGPGEAP